ncbi:MAG: ribosome biogenesis GTPase Der [Patescibacteria group bacterium]
MPAKRTRKLPVVAIVGRSNVGKSTLWNRLTESGRAIVSPILHTTRDRNYAPVLWRGTSIELVDTGGMDADQGNEIGRGILHQAELAVREADLVLFVADAKTGVMPQDRSFAQLIKKLNKHVLLVVNKTDTMKDFGEAGSKEMWGLNFGEAVPCSASTGRGAGDLLDRIYEELVRMEKPPQPIEDAQGLKLVIMGRPNVGKSSLLNAILGEERVIVSDIPHTTREPMDTHIEWKGEPVTLVDTAGIRKRTKIDGRVEEASFERNREALRRADVAFLVVDASEGAFDQDKHLAGLLEEEKKGLVIVVNKWDLIEDKTTKTAKEYEMRMRRTFPFLSWASIVFVSATQNLRATALLDLAFKIREERRRQITYNALQRFMKTVIARKKPLQDSGPQSPYIHDITQIGIEPPTFLIQVRGQRGNLHESWLRFFENRMREKFGFDGTPIEVKAHIAPLVREDMPEHMKNRPTRRKKPIGRMVGRY